MNQNSSVKINNLTNYTFTFEAVDKCPLCQNLVMIPNGRVSWLKNEFWYVICPKCGLKYMNPRPTQQSYRDYYKYFFWQQKIRNIRFKKSGQVWQGARSKFDDNEEWKAKKGRERVKKKLTAYRINDITRTLDHYKKLSKNDKVLDVGCSYPVVLNALRKKHGCQVFAIEPSTDAQRTIKKNKIELKGHYAEDLVQLAVDKEKFDVIIFSHVLENTINPITVLIAAQKCLTTDGAIYIQTPNLTVFDQMNPYHPYIFSPASLSFMVKKSGLKYHQASDQIERMLTVVCTKK